MAVLLVAMSITAIMLTVVMPVWKQMAQREKEEELVFRGQQYVRALRLFSTKYANASPPNIDVLVEQRFIRKKFKDPITNDDFQPILAGQALPGTQGGAQGQPGQGGSRGGPSTPATPGPGAAGGRGAAPAPATGQASGGINVRGISSIGTPGAGATGGVIGVVSKSKDKSIRLYNGRNHYNEWAFINTPQTQTPGAGAPGGAPGPGRGQRGGPGQPTTSPFGNGPFGGQRGRGGPAQPSGPPGRGFGPGTSPFPPGRGR
jgi:type II secretory pathway pseudopilin PulG